VLHKHNADVRGCFSRPGGSITHSPAGSMPGAAEIEEITLAARWCFTQVEKQYPATICQPL